MKRILILLSILALIVSAAGCTSSTSSNQAGVNVYREL
jgi:ABC-type phosphate/phosphonate transport system substrate-binding protein